MVAATGITTTSYTFTGLEPSTVYDFKVSSVCPSSATTYSSVVSARTVCNFTTFGYDDLNADYVQCSYGNYTVPDMTEGVMDCGYTNSMSRHTVHYDPTETDPRTGGMLHTVPEGYCSSVRLGNWNTNYEAERIVYTYTVDTTDADLLILKYAAVLQDPNHTPAE